MEEACLELRSDGACESVHDDVGASEEGVQGAVERVYLGTKLCELLSILRGGIAGCEADSRECPAVLGEEDLADVVTYDRVDVVRLPVVHANLGARSHPYRDFLFRRGWRQWL